MFFGEPTQSSHVAQLALIGRHAERGVTLQMLNRSIPFGPSKIDIGERHVILEIDEALARIACRDCSEDGLRRRRAADRHYRLRRRAGDKGLGCFIPIERATCLHVEVNDRCGPARYREQIGVPAFDLTRHARLDARQPLPRAMGRNWDRVVINSELRTSLLPHERRTSIKDRDNFSACARQCVGGAVSIIIVRRDHHALARKHAESLRIGAHGLRQHHAGSIIVGECNWSFDAAGG